jgi:hypothetical protein
MLTPEQQTTIDHMIAQFEAANAEIAKRTAFEQAAAHHTPTPEELSDSAAAMRLPDGSIPDGIMVIENGKYVSKSRESAIIGLLQGFFTL